MTWRVILWKSHCMCMINICLCCISRQHGGLRSLYTGMLPRCLRRTLMSALSWTVFEQVSFLVLFSRNDLKVYTAFVIPSYILNVHRFYAAFTIESKTVQSSALVHLQNSQGLGWVGEEEGGGRFLGLESPWIFRVFIWKHEENPFTWTLDYFIKRFSCLWKRYVFVQVFHLRICTLLWFAIFLLNLEFNNRSYCIQDIWRDLKKPLKPSIASFNITSSFKCVGLIVNCKTCFGLDKSSVKFVLFKKLGNHDGKNKLFPCRWKIELFVKFW